MSHLLSLRRAGQALVASALAISVVVGGTTSAHAVSSSSPAGRGATWLAHQLNKHGLIHNPNFGGFDDYGLTIDTALSLKATGGHPAALHHIRKAMRGHVSDYTTDAAFGFDDVFAGAVAKLLVFAQATGGGARNYGGTDLVSTLEDRVVTGGSARGRIQDVVDPASTSGDSANTIGQVFAARGLLAAHSHLAGAAVKYLLLQQCTKGYFRLQLGKAASSKQSCTRRSPADNDVTSLAVVQLWKHRKGHPALRRGLHHAMAWLVRQQGDKGGLGEGSTASNSNSTGLAAWALGTGGRCSAAQRAAEWVARLQVGGRLKGTALQGESGAIAFNHDDLRKARKHGITVEKQDSWRRATAQAAPGLLFLKSARCR